jgi:hypothetical protein
MVAVICINSLQIAIVYVGRGSTVAAMTGMRVSKYMTPLEDLSASSRP